MPAVMIDVPPPPADADHSVDLLFVRRAIGRKGAGHRRHRCATVVRSKDRFGAFGMMPGDVCGQDVHITTRSADADINCANLRAPICQQPAQMGYFGGLGVGCSHEVNHENMPSKLSEIQSGKARF